MKKIFILLLLITVYPLAAFSSSKYEVTRAGINTRVDSVIWSQSLGTLNAGDQVEVIGEKFRWFKIKLPSKIGCYIAKEFTQKTGRNQVKVTASKVNLRSGPSLEAPIIGSAPEGALFPFISEQGEWIKIKGYPYAKGWVHKKFLKKLPEKPPLELFVEGNIAGLSAEDIREKQELQSLFAEKGEKILPLLEPYISKCDNNSAYSFIAILTKLSQDKPELIGTFIAKAEFSSPRTASIYLDAAQSAVSEKIPYFYLMDKGELSSEGLKEAVSSLKNKLTQSTPASQVVQNTGTK